MASLHFTEMNSNYQHVLEIFLRHLHKLPSMLSCDDVNMRIAAGETLALLFELARETDAVSISQQFYCVGVMMTNC